MDVPGGEVIPPPFPPFAHLWGEGIEGERRRNQWRGICSSKRRRAVLTFRNKLLVLSPRLAGLTELELRSSIPTLAETVFFPRVDLVVYDIGTGIISPPIIMMHRAKHVDMCTLVQSRVLHTAMPYCLASPPFVKRKPGRIGPN